MVPPTRIAILSHTAQLGGAEIALLRLLQALPTGWDVTVVLFAGGDLEDPLRESGITVEVVPLPGRTVGQGRAGLVDPRVLVRSGWDSVAFVRQLADRLTGLGVDLVVANSLKAAVLGSVAARRARLPWVWHLHDRLSPDYLPLPVVLAMRLLARSARHVVANSRQSSRLTGLPSGRVSVAHPGLPASAFTGERRGDPSPVFGLLGRISSTKGQREFIQAAAMMAGTHPAAEFHVVGEALFNDQPYADEVRRLPESLGIADRVLFTGWATDPAAAIDGFTALVHASPVPEPFGQVIVEAMARHVPVIGTAAGGVSEILTGAEDAPEIPFGTALRTPYGQLVRASDTQGLAAAMAWVLEHPAAATGLAGAAAASARQRFAASTTAATCAAVWEQVLCRR